jgi:hypothetical protein
LAVAARFAGPALRPVGLPVALRFALAVRFALTVDFGLARGLRVARPVAFALDAGRCFGFTRACRFFFTPRSSPR